MGRGAYVAFACSVWSHQQACLLFFCARVHVCTTPNYFRCCEFYECRIASSRSRQPSTLVSMQPARSYISSATGCLAKVEATTACDIGCAQCSAFFCARGHARCVKALTRTAIRGRVAIVSSDGGIALCRCRWTRSWRAVTTRPRRAVVECVSVVWRVPKSIFSGRDEFPTFLPKY